MKQQIAGARTVDDIDTIMYAMELHPVINIAEALEESVAKGRISSSDELSDSIDFIIKNGVKVVEKS